MIGVAALTYKEVDPAKKDAKWADTCLQQFRRDWRPLVNVVRCRDNKRYLYSQQSLEEVINSFKDKKFRELIKNSNPLGIMETIVNTIVEEITTHPPKAELRATDPAAVNEKKQDILLLKNRKILENDVNKYQKQVS